MPDSKSCSEEPSLSEQETIHLCRKVYLQHRDALDFVIKHQSDGLDESEEASDDNLGFSLLKKPTS